MPPHLLIVDDEPQVVFFLHQVLKSTRPDYVVSTAQTGDQALQIAQREKLDLIIIDYQLKDVDGLTLIAMLEGLNQQPPVIMITAGPPPTMAGEANSNVLRCIQKPFSIAQLVTVISEMLDTGDPTSGSGDGRIVGRGNPPQEPFRGMDSRDGGIPGRDHHPRDPTRVRR